MTLTTGYILPRKRYDGNARINDYMTLHETVYVISHHDLTAFDNGYDDI